jgi:hypothetical protein
MRLDLVCAEYDGETERAYVEFCGFDNDGGEAIAAVICSYRTSRPLGKKQLQHELVRRARYILQGLRSSTAN